MDTVSSHSHTVHTHTHSHTHALPTNQKKKDKKTPQLLTSLFTSHPLSRLVHPHLILPFDCFSSFPNPSFIHSFSPVSLFRLTQVGHFSPYQHHYYTIRHFGPFLKEVILYGTKEYRSVLFIV